MICILMTLSLLFLGENCDATLGCDNWVFVTIPSRHGECYLKGGHFIPFELNEIMTGSKGCKSDPSKELL